MSIFIGIDPGKSGAMAIVSTDTQPFVRVVPFDEQSYAEVLRFHHEYDTIGGCVVERVNAMPGQGVTSMFSFGQNYGFIQGLLTAFNVPFELVMPRVWKKEFGVTSDKNTSIAVARRLFPDTPLKRTERCKKEDNNIAEALLLAVVARRKFGG